MGLKFLDENYKNMDMYKYVRLKDEMEHYRKKADEMNAFHLNKLIIENHTIEEIYNVDPSFIEEFEYRIYWHLFNAKFLFERDKYSRNGRLCIFEKYKDKFKADEFEVKKKIEEAKMMVERNKSDFIVDYQLHILLLDDFRPGIVSPYNLKAFKLSNRISAHLCQIDFSGVHYNERIEIM